MVTEVSNQQVLDELAERVRLLYYEHDVVKKLSGNKYYFDLDRLFSNAPKGATEYGVLLSKYLAALKTQNKIEDFDTLLVIDDLAFSPLLAGILLQIVIEHNRINSERPIRNPVVYKEWLEAPTPSHHFYPIPTPKPNVNYQGVLILDAGEYNSSLSTVMHAILDLKRTGMTYLEHKPNLRGVLQIVDHENGFSNWLQEKAKELLGYPISYHRILPASAFNGR